MIKLTIKEVNRSLQKFEDLTDDVIQSNWNMFFGRLKQLIQYCETDRVLQRVGQQLNSSADFDVWYEERNATAKGMYGSGKLEFPSNSDEEISIYYQLLKKVSSEEINLEDFYQKFLSEGKTGSQYSDYLDKFNQYITKPFLREMERRIEDIKESLPKDPKEEVLPTSIQINATDAANVVLLNAQGSGNTQTASIEGNNQLEEEFKKLVQEIQAQIGDEKERADKLELVKAAKDLVMTDKSNATGAKALLNMLPSLGNIASIVSAIIAVL